MKKGKSPEGKLSGPSKHSRRRFLQVAGLGAAATVASPQVSRAQTATWKFQSTWPNRDIFHEFCNDFAKRVNDMSGGRLKLDVLASGAVVPAFQLQDAVHAGILDGGHGVSGYWYGKNKAFSLFGTPPSFGWNANSFLGWMNYGGGYELYNELLRTLKINVVGFLTGPMPNQPLGWFKNPITTPDQIRGLKYRTIGLSADLNQELGAAVTILAGGEIVPALERGVIDGAEFNNPSSDLVLGFPDVAKNYMLKSYHQASETFEVIFNKTKFDTLPAELKAIVKHAAEAASADMSWKALDRYSKDLEALKARGVNIQSTPDVVMKAQLDAWNKVIEKLSSDPFFKKVIDSQKAWVQRTYAYERANEPSRDVAYDHFFKTT
ncbi:C4-dicarboxylate ABC transporter [Microvirga sp. KLBC 81]|uniref:TRAP transporter substrate-binding protein n=1 Tax=Microvirga sp. KLBC 81 TaxID=1862707 RepID=UPI000D5126F6|nr:TRAP transporter substrate-binding protein [Microvirga sp. KLBC 81]PVE23926.1 C4-dicarboxylate ABC transporter [Microvirga sp. KLBC 81]